MQITLANNLRELRKNKNLTQEELAGYLNISPQAISKWERGEGFPDIAMLPVIANYFGVTIDTLLGNDTTSIEEKIRHYCDEYEIYNAKGNMDKAAQVAAQAYHEFPYHWNIIDIYCMSLTRGYSVHPEEKLPELRGICQLIMDKCTDAKIRMHAVYSMLFAEDDEYIEKWFAEVPGTYDYSEWERREDRYYERGQIEKFRHQKQENMYQLYSYLREKMALGIQSPKEKIAAYRHQIALINAVFGEDNLVCEKGTLAIAHIRLASALFEVDEKAEAYETLEKGITLYQEYCALPEGTELCYVGLFDTKTRLINQSACERVEKMITFLKGNKMMDGFKRVADDDRYQRLIARLTGLLL